MQLCFTDLLQYFEVGGALHLICKRPEIAINLHSGHIVTKCTWQPTLQHILPFCPTTTPFHPHHLPNPKLPPYLQCEFHTQSNQAESEKPRQRVSNADRKVFANPESFCDKFIIG